MHLSSGEYWHPCRDFAPVGPEAPRTFRTEVEFVRQCYERSHERHPQPGQFEGFMIEGVVAFYDATLTEQRGGTAPCPLF